jgi:hypothetical protein
MIVNATGLFSQLVAAHVGERGVATAMVEAKAGDEDAKIEAATARVADLDRQIALIDGAVAEATKRGKTNAAMSTMDSQRKTRAALVDARNAEAAFKAERSHTTAEAHQQAMEAAPIVYVADLLDITSDSERAVRWLIALVVLCTDPLAVALTAAASSRRRAA